MTHRYAFVIHRPHGAGLGAFRDGLLGATANALLALRPESLSIDVVLDPEMGGPGMNAARESDGARVSALVTTSVRDPADAKKMAAILDPTGAFLDGYAVTQDVPRDYEREWELGETSPGVRQVTLLRPKPDLAYADFMEHWHGKHGPLALEIHPIWRYDRNVVNEAITDDAAPIAGIVGLHFRELEDVVDKERLFGADGGDPTENMRRIAADVSSFIDMSTIVVVNMREHVLA